MKFLSTYSVSTPLLLVALALFLILGLVAIVAIVLIVRRCPSSTNQITNKSKKETTTIDAWKEAGNRILGDFDEPT